MFVARWGGGAGVKTSLEKEESVLPGIGDKNL